jgi:tetratricopeptide (TPR) repeat protein
MLDDPMPLKNLPIVGTILSSAILIVSVWTVMHFRRIVAVPMAVAFFWIGLLPTLGIVPIYLNMDQIRLYMPLAGFSFLFAMALNFLIKKTRWRPEFLLLAVVLLYAGVSVQQHLHFRSAAQTWHEVSLKYPRSDIALSLLGDALIRERNYSGAIEVFGQSALMQPGNPTPKLKQIVLRLKIGDDKQEILKELATMDRSLMGVRARLNLGNAYSLAEENQQAEKVYLDIIERKPSYTNAHLNLGTLWVKMGDYKRARLAFKNVLIIAPRHNHAKEQLKMVEEKLANEEQGKMPQTKN